jgi:FecR-like protein
MKQTQLLFTAVCGAVLAMTSLVSADTIKSGFATVVRVQGEARYSLGDGNWHPLVAGKIISPGAVIQTGHDGVVDVALGNKIEFPQARSAPDKISFAPDSNVRGLITYRPSVEQNMVRLTSDTTLQIDKLEVSDIGEDAVSDTELNLKEGQIFAAVKKLSATSQYLIKIPNGIAGIRGTVVDVNLKKGAPIVAVLASSSTGSDVVVSLVNADGTTGTFEVALGSELMNGQVSPIPPALLNFLQKTLVPVLKTPYLEIISVAERIDRTTLFTSVFRPPVGTATSEPGGGGIGPGDGDDSLTIRDVIGGSISSP